MEQKVKKNFELLKQKWLKESEKNQKELKNRIGDLVTGDEFEILKKIQLMIHNSKTQSKASSKSLYFAEYIVTDINEYQYISSNKDYSISDCDSESERFYRAILTYNQGLVEKLFIVRGIRHHYFLVFVSDNGKCIQLDLWGFNLICEFSAKALFEYSISPTFVNLEIVSNAMIGSQYSRFGFKELLALPDEKKFKTLRNSFKQIENDIIDDFKTHKKNSKIYKRVYEEFTSLNKKSVFYDCISKSNSYLFFLELVGDSHDNDKRNGLEAYRSDVKKQNALYENIIYSDFAKIYNEYIEKLDKINEGIVKKANSNLTDIEISESVKEKTTEYLVREVQKMNIYVTLTEYREAFKYGINKIKGEN
jgi:hypothetical protein